MSVFLNNSGVEVTIESWFATLSEQDRASCQAIWEEHHARVRAASDAGNVPEEVESSNSLNELVARFKAANGISLQD